jgi:hypothetical protein
MLNIRTVLPAHPHSSARLRFKKRDIQHMFSYSRFCPLSTVEDEQTWGAVPSLLRAHEDLKQPSSLDSRNGKIGDRRNGARPGLYVIGDAPRHLIRH